MSRKVVANEVPRNMFVQEPTNERARTLLRPRGEKCDKLFSQKGKGGFPQHDEGDGSFGRLGG